MTVTQIVKDLLEHNMITMETATVLLQTELKANMFDNQVKNTNQEFQPYHRFQNMGTTNPYYISTTTNDPIKGTTTGITAGANELLKVK
jgi:hypothetical protein